MEELTLFRSEESKVENIAINDDEQTVSARDLYEKLDLNERFSKWFDRLSEYGFSEGVDYTPYQKVHPQNQQNIIDYNISIEMAKQICMLQRTEKGRAYREYFLKLEKVWNSPEMIMRRALQFADKKMTEMKAKISLLEPKAELADALTGSNNAVSMAEAVKVLGLPFGRNVALSILRERGILQRDNIPYQEYINRGYFRVRESPWKDGEGNIRITMVTEVHQKGLKYLKSLFEQAIGA